MHRLTISHRTEYRYARPVDFNEHRILYRPRDSEHVRLVDATLAVTPRAATRWYHDVFGNSITIADILEPADRLVFECTLVIDHYGDTQPEFPAEPSAGRVPFTYPADELPDLGRTIERHYPDPEREIDDWARGFLDEDGTAETFGLLSAMTGAIRDRFRYQARDEHGVQTPLETLERGAGSCRDYALFMMEAARSLGLAARFVTGYLYDPALDGTGERMIGAGSTHAWVQIYIPGAGWREFDPTNGLIGPTNLVRVGVGREPSQVVPLKGSYVGAPEDFMEMNVSVHITAETSLGATGARR